MKGGGAGGRSSAAAGRASGSLVSHWSPGVAPEVTVEGAPLSMCAAGKWG